MIVPAIAIIVGVVLQAACASSLAIGTVQPNLALLGLTVASMFVGAEGGAGLGFAAGLMEGAFVSMNVGSLIVSRVVTAWAIGALERRVFRDSWIVALGVVFCGTMVSETLFLLFAPQPDLPVRLARVVAASAYNGVLSAPLYLTVRGVLRRSGDHDPVYS